MSNLKESDKVVYIGISHIEASRCGTNVTHSLVGFPLTIGSVYVVEKVIPDIFSAGREDGLRLVGSTYFFNGCEYHKPEECGHWSIAFRKLEEIQAESKLRQSEAEQLEEAKKLINLY